MLYREITAVCSQIHTEHINTVCVCGQNLEFLNLKSGGTNSNHWAVKVIVQHTVSDTAINTKKKQYHAI
jgi:hypothetical protein